MVPFFPVKNHYTEAVLLWHCLALIVYLIEIFTHMFRGSGVPSLAIASMYPHTPTP